jgi:hypothetical protein
MTDLFLVTGLGVVVYMATQAIKTVTDLLMGKTSGGVPKRKTNVWVNRVAFPAVPVFLGIALAVVIPFRPTFLIEFVNEYVEGFSSTLVYGAYGAIVGQFSDYAYSKAKSFFQEFKLKAPR